jgi:hypothetical protein
MPIFQAIKQMPTIVISREHAILIILLEKKLLHVWVHPNGENVRE